MPSSVGFFTKLKGGLLGRGFDAAADDPGQAQEQFLQRLLKTRAETDFGREHSFSSLASREDWNSAVPIRDYEGFRPYIDRMVAGEKDILVPGDVLMYATTSGTTCLPKLIPVTEDFKSDISALTTLWVSRCQRDHPAMLRQGIFTMVGPAIESYTSSGRPVGSVSGLTRARMPWFIRKAYCNPAAVSEISNYDLRYFVAMRMSLARSVSMMVTPNPTTLLRLAQVGGEFSERLIKAIHDGGLGVEAHLLRSAHGPSAEETAQALLAQIRPDPSRARFLESACDDDGVLRPKNAWPDLTLIGCWLGGSAGVQASWLDEWYGPVPRRDLGLRATEATMTVPVTDGTPFGVPAVGNVFFEFIPEVEIDDAHPTVLRLHELEEGKHYYILLTTRGGLYRYDINDIVEVRGRYRNTPLIAFVRKGRDMANITGEKLHVNQVMAAARDATEASGLQWTQIRVIPDLEASRYDLLIEPKTASPGSYLMERFSEAFDEALTRHNEEWGGKRRSRRLHLPIVHEMRQGWFRRAMAADIEATGKRAAQYKWSMIAPAWADSCRKDVLARQADSATYLLSLEEAELEGGTQSMPDLPSLEVGRSPLPKAPTLEQIKAPLFEEEEEEETTSS